MSLLRQKLGKMEQEILDTVVRDPITAWGSDRSPAPMLIPHIRECTKNRKL